MQVEQVAIGRRLLNGWMTVAGRFGSVQTLLLLVLFGMIDFGQAFTMWTDETHLANSAARYAAVRQSLGEPDPFRLKYREALRTKLARLTPGAPMVTDIEHDRAPDGGEVAFWRRNLTCSWAWPAEPSSAVDGAVSYCSSSWRMRSCNEATATKSTCEGCSRR